MTVEELELLQRHPRFPKRLVPVLLAELKRQRAIEEGANDAAELERGRAGGPPASPHAVAARRALRQAALRPGREAAPVERDDREVQLVVQPRGRELQGLRPVRRAVGGETGVTTPVDVEKLKRDLSEALVALRQGKGYLGVDALSDDLENLAANYRFLASEVRASAKDSAKLKAAVVKAISKLERPTSP